jgi:hypothetical protein
MTAALRLVSVDSPLSRLSPPYGLVPDRRIEKAIGES